MPIWYDTAQLEGQPKLAPRTLRCTVFVAFCHHSTFAVVTEQKLGKEFAMMNPVKKNGSPPSPPPVRPGSGNYKAATLVKSLTQHLENVKKEKTSIPPSEEKEKKMESSEKPLNKHIT